MGKYRKYSVERGFYIEDLLLEEASNFGGVTSLSLASLDIADKIIVQHNGGIFQANVKDYIDKYAGTNSSGDTFIFLNNPVTISHGGNTIHSPWAEAGYNNTDLILPVNNINNGTIQDGSIITDGTELIRIGTYADSQFVNCQRACYRTIAQTHRPINDGSWWYIYGYPQLIGALEVSLEPVSSYLIWFNLLLKYTGASMNGDFPDILIEFDKPNGSSGICYLDRRKTDGFGIGGIKHIGETVNIFNYSSNSNDMLSIDEPHLITANTGFATNVWNAPFYTSRFMIKVDTGNSAGGLLLKAATTPYQDSVYQDSVSYSLLANSFVQVHKIS